MVVVACLWIAVGSALAVTPVSFAAEPTPHELHSEIRVLQKQTEHTESFVSQLLLPLTILVGLLAGGGVIGLITSIRYERRQSQLHDLAVRGETASQGRAEQSHVAFLAGSQETLNLVNDTLALARQANERATEAMQQKARERLDEFDRTAQAILDEAYTAHDFKVVIKNASLRDDLVDVAHKLDSIAYLGLYGASPTPACLFAQGLAHHLESAPKKALVSLRAAENSDDKELSALALYWAGYEANNIGEYTRALDHFRQAHGKYLDDDERAQHHELHRMEIKTRFFEFASSTDVQSGREALIGELFHLIDVQLEQLAGDPRSEFVKERRLCHETRAEMLVWCARVSPLEREHDEPYSPDERKCLEEAMEQFELGAPHLWSQFGLLQTRWLLGQTVSKAEYDDLHETLVDETHTHRERRSITLRDTAILIAEKEQATVTPEHLNRTHRDVRDSLSHVDHAITLFSPWRKSNVPYDLFDEELKAYFRGADTQYSPTVSA